MISKWIHWVPLRCRALLGSVRSFSSPQGDIIFGQYFGMIFLDDSNSWFEDSRGWKWGWRLAKDLDVPKFWPRIYAFQCSKVNCYFQFNFWLLFIIIWYKCIHKKLKIINSSEEKKSCSSRGNWTRNLSGQVLSGHIQMKNV